MDGETIPVPCGKCPTCLGRRASAWSFRLTNEDRYAQSSHFITLTYDTDYVPITDKGYMSLDKKHYQLFMKRLRKANKGTKIKYFAVGEYGGKTERPHYHIILFNCAIETIQNAWGMGAVHYGQVTGASVGYCLKYICKPGKIPRHKNDDRKKEFALMSKGLGEKYLTKDMVSWHKNDLEKRMYIVIEDGKKISMPRYYKDKLYNDQERKKIKAHHAELAVKLQDEFVDSMRKRYGNTGWQEKQKENVLHAFDRMAKNYNDNRKKI